MITVPASEGSSYSLELVCVLFLFLFFFLRGTFTFIKRCHVIQDATLQEWGLSPRAAQQHNVNTQSANHCCAIPNQLGKDFGESLVCSGFVQHSAL